MHATLATVALTAPLVLAGERDFFHIPSAEDVRLQPIARAGNEQDWPFAVDKGQLACSWSTGIPLVFFFEDTDGETDPRGVLLSSNPLELIFGNVANHDLFVASASVEERLKRVAPFIDIGRKLCEQPPGARVGHGEL